MREADLDRAADIAARTPTRTRARSTATAIRALLQEAWEGTRPQH